VIRYAIELVRSLVKSERGQDLIEYAMLGGLIALALIAVATLGVLTGAVSAMATGIGNCIDFNSVSVCKPW
jgi:Flp pilus assembly pilin Flp